MKTSSAKGSSRSASANGLPLTIRSSFCKSTRAASRGDAMLPHRDAQGLHGRLAGFAHGVALLAPYSDDPGNSGLRNMIKPR